MRTRIVIADDQAVVRAGFRMILADEPDFDVVGEAEDGLAVIEVVRAFRPDVVVMDVRMPRLDGIAATEAILALPLSRPPKVLVVTTFDLDDYVFGALAAGASGFLLKDVTPHDLISAVRVIAAGDSVVAPRATRELIHRYVGASRTKHHDPRTERLTEREHEVLRALAQGWSNAKIGTVLHLSEATVKTHVSRILNKLELQSRVQAVVLAYQTGLDRER